MYQLGTETIERIAAELKVNFDTEREWIKHFEHGGLDTISEHERNQGYTEKFKNEAVQAYLRVDGF